MGHHIDGEDRFQSDKYPDLAPDKIVVSFTDPRAWRALAAVAQAYRPSDPELADDIEARLRSLKKFGALEPAYTPPPPLQGVDTMPTNGDEHIPFIAKARTVMGQILMLVRWDGSHLYPWRPGDRMGDYNSESRSIAPEIITGWMPAPTILAAPQSPLQTSGSLPPNDGKAAPFVVQIKTEHGHAMVQVFWDMTGKLRADHPLDVMGYDDTILPRDVLGWMPVPDLSDTVLQINRWK